MSKAYTVRSAWLAAVTTTIIGLSLGTAQAQTPVKYTLDWKFEGQTAFSLVALDKGYFKSEGLDVTIDTAGGSLEPLNRVASGTYDIGFGDINSLIKFRDANPAVPVKAIFMVYNRPPFSIIGRKSRGVSKPKDLEGRKLGAPLADGAFAQWKIFTQANGIDASKVIIENVGFPVREPMLASGQVDAIAGFVFSVIGLKANGVAADDLSVMLMSDYGLNLYGNAIIVNPAFAAEKPEVVRKFLSALLKGLKDTIADPGAAIESVVKRNSTASRDVELERLQLAVKSNFVSDETRANGLGGIEVTRLDKAIDQIAITYDFKNPKPKAGDIFDPSFLPAPSERKM